MKSTLARLERLVAAQNGGGPCVSLLFPCDDATWDLTSHMSNGEIRVSNHKTMEEGQTAYDALLKKYKSGKSDPVLIIDDL